MTSPLSTEAPQATYASYGQPLWRRVLLSREMAIVALLILVSVYASVTVPYFADPYTLTLLLLDSTTVLLIAMPMALVMITGDIDLSVGSMVGLSSVLFGLFTQAGWPVIGAIAAAVCCGLIGGLINGFLVTSIELPSLAVTIGTMALYRGIAVGLLGTTAITTFPPEWSALATATIGDSPIPLVMVLVLVLLVVFTLVLHFTPFGRGIYVIGLSKQAAVFSGVNVSRTRVILFALTGGVSALAGVFYTLYYGSARGDNATGLELQVIAAVVLGGVSVFGGRGAMYGVMAGVLLIGVLASALRLASVTSDVINIITGALLVLSVVMASVLNWVQSRRARAAATAAKPAAA